MKIALFEVKGWEKTHIRKQLKGHDLKFFDEKLNDVAVGKYKDSECVCVFVNSTIDKKVVASLPKLRLIATMSTGFDHIDLKTAEKKKITVCSVPFYGENTVAEHTFALILSLSRNVHRAYMRSVQGIHKIDGLMGFDLKGKTLGLIGGGHIGLHVARMAKAFGMNVLVFDLNKDHFKEEILGFKYADMDTVVKSSDVISLHVPYNEHTHHMVNKQMFSKMKKGVILVNTARGGVIDTAALLWALEKRIVRGAGLDVLENEQDITEERVLLNDKTHIERQHNLIRNHMLLNNENVVYTPHIAFFSREALVRILDTTAKNIDKYLEGNPGNVVRLK